MGRPGTEVAVLTLQTGISGRSGHQVVQKFTRMTFTRQSGHGDSPSIDSAPLKWGRRGAGGVADEMKRFSSDATSGSARAVSNGATTRRPNASQGHQRTSLGAGRTSVAVTVSP